MIRRTLAAAAGLSTLLAANPAAAQIDSGIHEVFQYGRPVAEVYVAEGQDPCSFVEHWFFFEDYVYPHISNGASITVTPVETAYESLKQFLDVQRGAHPGGTYTEVVSIEHSESCK